LRFVSKWKAFRYKTEGVLWQNGMRFDTKRKGLAGEGAISSTSARNCYEKQMSCLSKDMACKSF
jgi:hypothetical protein